MNKKQTIPRYLFGFSLIIVGLVLDYLELGKDFLGFSSVGAWMIFIGFIILTIVTITLISKKSRIVDERMQKLAFQASRITFLFLIFGAFIIMIIDGINRIEIPYRLFMSHMIAWLMVVYFISYKILERYY
ncbi:MAG: DUF2178 domain-containing protein [Candidatus Nanoarchaeia archaeon]